MFTRKEEEMTMSKFWSIAVAIGVLAPAPNAFADNCLGGSVTSNSGFIVACPKGDGPTLASKGLTISVRVLDQSGNPIVGLAAHRIWLASSSLYTCPGTLILTADAPTNWDGRTTFSGALRAGGCSEQGLNVMVRYDDLDYVLAPDPNDCDSPFTVPIFVRSPDLNADGTIGLADFSMFQYNYQNGPYDACYDFDGSGTRNLADFSIFTSHYGTGSNPVHSCP